MIHHNYGNLIVEGDSHILLKPITCLNYNIPPKKIIINCHPEMGMESFTTQLSIIPTIQHSHMKEKTKNLQIFLQMRAFFGKIMI
jgi:hypothetical protein